MSYLEVWEKFNPEVKQRIKSLIVPSEVEIVESDDENMYIFDNVDAHKLIDMGCIEYPPRWKGGGPPQYFDAAPLRLKNGKFVLMVPLNGLVATGQVNLIKRYLKELWDSRPSSEDYLSSYILWEFYLNQNKKPLEELLKNSDEIIEYPLPLVILLICELGEVKTAIKIMRNWENYLDLQDNSKTTEYSVGILLDYSRIWKYLLDNESQTSRYLQQAQKISEYPARRYWNLRLQCAAGWALIVNDREGFAQCIESAEKNIEVWRDGETGEKIGNNCGEWLLLANVFDITYSDLENVKRCVENAAKEVSDFDSCSDCAGGFAYLMYDIEKGKELLVEAEEYASIIWDWKRLCNRWIRDFNCCDKARECLLRAEKLAVTHDDWESCSWTWRDNFKDEKEMRRCLVNAEKALNPLVRSLRKFSRLFK